MGRSPHTLTLTQRIITRLAIAVRESVTLIVHVRRVGATRASPVVVTQHAFAWEAGAVAERRGAAPVSVAGAGRRVGLDYEWSFSGRGWDREWWSTRGR
jgi:hypothetical protein